MESSSGSGVLHEYFILHVLLNAAYVSVGIVLGRFLAWATGVERRYRIRSEFIFVFVVLAVVTSLLITTLTADPAHFVLSILGGLAGGFVSALWSRRQAQPTAVPPGRASARRPPSPAQRRGPSDKR